MVDVTGAAEWTIRDSQKNKSSIYLMGRCLPNITAWLMGQWFDGIPRAINCRLCSKMTMKSRRHVKSIWFRRAGISDPSMSWSAMRKHTNGQVGRRYEDNLTERAVMMMNLTLRSCDPIV